METEPGGEEGGQRGEGGLYLCPAAQEGPSALNRAAQEDGGGAGGGLPFLWGPPLPKGLPSALGLV